jgi:hypothetical protein
VEAFGFLAAGARGDVSRFAAMAVSLILAGSGTALAGWYDVSADWSDTDNPNDAWSYWVDGSLGVSGTRGSDPFATPPGAASIWMSAAGTTLPRGRAWLGEVRSEPFAEMP